MKNLAVTITENQNLAVGVPYLQTATSLATHILADVMQFRRTVHSEVSCDSASCQACFAPHFERIVTSIERRKPITFVLPAFPGKSPNLAKVLGPLPDMAERHALKFLSSLCDRIKRIYPPGAHIILCSDGRVFSDIVGMREDDVTAYQHEIDQMIVELGITNISTFNLDAVSAGDDFVKVRDVLMKQYGQTLESLQEKVRGGDKEAHQMYCGITRFLFEDSLHPNQTKSRTAIQKDCRARAYQVILRSNAWSELIAERFPAAVRLSIHPQACGAAKLGIQLLGVESWMTPWHGVAVETQSGFVLMKRWEAEKLEAALVQDANGRPSHFKLVERKLA